MLWKSRKVAVIGVAALVAVGGGVGGALAAGGSDPATPRQAFLNDAAQRLGVTPDALRSALKAAAADRIAAAAAGRLTPGQGRHQRLGLRRIVKAAADYLGLTPLAILQQLRQGKSLADVAQTQGKTADGLESAILDAVKARLDKAVSNNRLGADQEQQLLDRLKARLDKLVNRHFGQNP